VSVTHGSYLRQGCLVPYKWPDEAVLKLRRDKMRLRRKSGCGASSRVSALQMPRAGAKDAVEEQITSFYL
jgi:hypothetical protein